MPFDNKNRFADHGWDDETKERLLALPGYVVLGRRLGDNALSAIIEHSWSMGESIDRCLFWFIRADMKKERVLQNCEHYRDMFSKDGKDFQVWDVRDPDLPIEINWEEWLWAQGHSDKTVSGVRDKFRARNPTFIMKEEPCLKTSISGETYPITKPAE